MKNWNFSSFVALLNLVADKSQSKIRFFDCILKTYRDPCLYSKEYGLGKEFLHTYYVKTIVGCCHFDIAQKSHCSYGEKLYTMNYESEFVKVNEDYN